MTLEEIKKQRFSFLNKVYETTDGNPSHMLNMYELGREMKMDDQLTGKIVQYLINEELLEPRALGGAIGISHNGILEVEDALSNPNRATQHFLPINIINVQSMSNSVIQQGTAGSTQTVNINDQSLDDLKNFITELKSFLDELELPTDARNELLSEILTLNAQASSPRPKRSIIGDALVSIKGILEGVIGNLITPIFQTSLPHLITTFCSHQ